MGDEPPRAPKSETEPAQSDVGLYAPKERYTRDIPPHEEGPEDAPVIKGADPGGSEPEPDS